MALFSTGGLTYPDIAIVLFLAACFVVSSILNPTLFLYNYRKPVSIPVFLFRLLAVVDFLTCLFIPLKAGISIGHPGDLDCFEINMFYNFYKISSQTNLSLNIPGSYRHHWCNSIAITLGIQIYSVIVWILIFTPSCITGIMTICRYIQIRKPFAILKLKFLVAFFVIYETYMLGFVVYFEANKLTLLNLSS